MGGEGVGTRHPVSPEVFWGGFFRYSVLGGTLEHVILLFGMQYRNTKSCYRVLKGGGFKERR